jgi:uncharacterized protein YaiL (DUF2058 family)
MFDNDRNSAVTLAVGVAGDETAAKASFGFEFGGSHHPVPKMVTKPVDSVTISEDEYHALLLAQVQQEDFEEQQQMVADKFAQYDNLIKAREAERARKEAELERLRRKVEKQQAEQAEADERRAKVRRLLEEKNNERKSKSSDS